METIRVDLDSRSYPIYIGPGLIDRFEVFLGKLENVSRLLVVDDGNVDAFFGETIERILEKMVVPAHIFTVPPGEASKSISTTAALWENFLEAGADRQSVVVVVGGGMTGDLAGFAAATYMRGIRLFQVPTTLLAQVDSSVGGKTAIDLDAGKNSVGAFHQPVGVLIDTDLLKTLPKREYLSGLGEVIKYGVGLDRDLFAFLEKNADRIVDRDSACLTEIVATCCQIKAKIVNADERETNGIRALLNLGHTFAHAYETADGFTNLLHGEAVALGILDALDLAERLPIKGITPELTARVRRLYQQLGIAARLDPAVKADNGLWEPERVLSSMRKDKKSAKGMIRFVLPTALGESDVFDEIPERLVLETLCERL